MIVYIICPTNKSGGPELLHQLCHELRNLNIDAKIQYVEKKTYSIYDKKYVYPSIVPIDEYRKYNICISKQIQDIKSNVVVFPESCVWLLPKIKKCKKVFWWLSVGNYIGTINGKRGKLYARLGLIKGMFSCFKKEIIHLCQSEYAKQFLLKNFVNESKIFMLTDYLNETFIQNARDEESQKKENVVLYNPKKGYEFTKKIIDFAPNIQWVPLINLSRNEMSKLMQTSKVYIDFGDHPGRDRIPREAAISGCCVITSKKGSAAFFEDVPILSKYKFDETEQEILNIVKCIELCINEYEIEKSNFFEYRNLIKNQEKIFKNEVISFANLINDISEA